MASKRAFEASATGNPVNSLAPKIAQKLPKLAAKIMPEQV